MSEWFSSPLAEVLDFREGPGIMASDFQNDGIPLIRLAGLKSGASLLQGANYLDAELVARKWSHFRLQLGDVLLSTSASLGEVAVVGPEGVGAVPYTGIIRFRARDKRIDPAFIGYMLVTQSFRRQIEAMGVGSVMRHFGPSHLRQMTVSYPSRRDQAAIAEVLGALDDKRAANERVAALAFKLAEAKYWCASGTCVRSAALGDVAELVLGGTPSRARGEFWINGSIPWLASAKANEERVLSPTEWITREALEKSAAKWMPAKATILAITGATLGQVARIEIAAAGNQSLVGIWHDDPALNDWLYFAVRGSTEELMRHSTGAAQQHVNKGDVERIRVPLPEPEQLQTWALSAGGLLDLAASKDRESAILARTRDELHMLLMAGKVRLRDAERTVEEVL